MNVKKTGPLDLHLAYRKAFESEQGQLVLEDLKRRGFHEEVAFSPDPGRAAFNEGRRSMLLHVMHMLDPERFQGFRPLGHGQEMQ